MNHKFGRQSSGGRVADGADGEGAVLFDVIPALVVDLEAAVPRDDRAGDPGAVSQVGICRVHDRTNPLLHQIAGVAAYFGQGKLGVFCRMSQRELNEPMDETRAIALLQTIRERIMSTLAKG